MLLNTLLAALIGLLLAVGVAYLMEYLDDTLKSPGDVEAATGLPTLGTIMRMKGDGGRSEIYRLATILYPRSPAAEAYRTLRTNIEFASVDAPVRIILVTRVHLLGALLADTPHTRPIPVSTSTNDRELMTSLGLAPSTYEGPTGILGVLGDTLSRAGIEVLSLWAAVPHYVSHPPCPKATLALLSALEQLMDSPLDLGELPELAPAWERGVDELAAEDSEVAEYVATLEEQQDAADLPRPAARPSPPSSSVI